MPQSKHAMHRLIVGIPLGLVKVVPSLVFHPMKPQKILQCPLNCQPRSILEQWALNLMENIIEHFQIWISRYIRQVIVIHLITSTHPCPAQPLRDPRHQHQQDVYPPNMSSDNSSILLTLGDNSPSSGQPLHRDNHQHTGKPQRVGAGTDAILPTPECSFGIIDGGNATDCIVPKQQRHKRRTKVSIVGSSLVRGLGNMVNNDDTYVCCHTFPGGTVERIAPRLPEVTHADDDVIVIAAGSNNIPQHDVPTIIRWVGEMIDDIQEIRPNAHLIIQVHADTMTQTLVIYTGTRLTGLMSFCNTNVKRTASYFFAA